MVELRKRKAPPSAPAPAKKHATTKKFDKRNGTNSGAKVQDNKEHDKTKEKTPKAKIDDQEKATRSSALSVGDTIELDTFGGEVETHEGQKTSLKQLAEDSKTGVVLFTYPKASTPGCTTQACAFRDGHPTLTGGGLEIYGLSSDSPKSNANFKTKQLLPYTLLCNPSYSLIGAIGMQQGSAHKTRRGVFAIDKKGKVLLAMAGGPIPTVDAVKKLVDDMARR